MIEIDLTLRKLFADADHLLLDDNLHYKRKYGDHHSHDFYPSHDSPSISVFLRNMVTIPDCLFEQRPDYEQILIDIFGEESYAVIDPFYAMNSGLTCDCCGRSLNVLTRAFTYALCEACDERESETQRPTLL